MWESHLRASIKRLLLARIGGGSKRAGPARDIWGTAGSSLHGSSESLL